MSYNDQQPFEIVKLEIRGKTIEYSGRKRKETKKLEIEIEKVEDLLF